MVPSETEGRGFLALQAYISHQLPSLRAAAALTKFLLKPFDDDILIYNQ